MFDNDKGGKWLIRHHGGSLLRLAGLRGPISWKAVQAEPVQPRRLPDGLIEVRRRGKPGAILFALEVSTYPYPRIARQAADDAMLIFLERGAVPEVVSLVLRPRGNQQAPRELDVKSPVGTTRIRVEWKVIELWKVPVAELLATGDVGLIPLVPLSQFDGPVEPILDECRERIERDAPAEEREALRVVTHFFAGLKYNDPRLFEKLGGQKAMIKNGSPLIRELYREAIREGRREDSESAILAVLTDRFGAGAEALQPELGAISDARLKDFAVLAATCPDLASFRAHLPARTRKNRRKS
jgi:hypothetical protein